MIIGVNKESGWTAVQSVVKSPMRAYRAYNPPPVNVPSEWPGPDAKPVPQGVKRPLISFRPNVTDTIAGKLDDQLTAFFDQMPPYARVTAWHEAEGDRWYYTPDQITAMHSHLYNLLSTSKAPLSAEYGQVFGSYVALNPKASHYPLTKWLTPGLDFYGVDYYTNSPAVVHTDLTAILRQVEQATEADRLDIWECNSLTPTQYRADVIEMAYRTAKEYLGSSIFCLYFGAGTPAGAWNPDDQDVIKLLNEMAADQTRY